MMNLDPDAHKGGPIYTIKLVGPNEPYQPEHKKPIPQPPGYPAITLHINKSGRLIGIQISGGDEPEVVGPGKASQQATALSLKEKYNLGDVKELFPKFDTLLGLLKSQR